MIAIDMILSDSESPWNTHFEYINIRLIFTHQSPIYCAVYWANGWAKVVGNETKFWFDR